jgi:predicted ester cyclase
MTTVVAADEARSQEANKAVYRRFVEIINNRELDKLPEVLDVEKLREFCVGAMPDWYAYDDAVANLKRVLAGIPDVKLTIEDSVAEGDKVISKVIVSGTNTGRLFNMPATGRSFSGPIFDFVQLENGKIVKRWQQGDNMGQFFTLYGPWLKWAGIASGVLVLGLIGGLIAALVA